MTLGLVIVAGGAVHPVADHVHTGYGLLLPGFILMGIGMGLVMSPMSTAAMNAVDRTKAGVASGTLSMSRMVGGTFGVAVMGALVAAIGRAQTRLEPPPPVAGRDRAAIANALGAGGSVSGAHVSPQIVDRDQRRVRLGARHGLTVSATVARRRRRASAPC